MATQVAEWVIKFDDKGTPTLEKLKAGLDDVDKRVKKTEGAASVSLGSIGKGLAAYFSFSAIQSGLTSLTSDVIKNTSEFEKYQAVLTNLYGSSKAAGQAMAMIQDVAATTPFQVNELTQAYVKLANRGINPTSQDIVSLGDFAASTGKSFDQLTEAILDASNPERWKEFGVKVKRDNGLVTLSYKGMTETVQDNAVAVSAVIEKWGKVPGIAGNMAAQAATLGGKISNLSDNWDQLTIAIGQSNNGFLNFAVEGLAGAVKWMKSMVQPLNATEQGLKEEEMRLRSLRQALLDVKTPEEKRLELLKQLKREYPDLIGNIKDEAKAIGDVAEKIQGQINLTIKKQALAANEKKFQALVARASDAEVRLEEYRMQMADAVGKLGARFQRDAEAPFRNATTGLVDYDAMAQAFATDANGFASDLFSRYSLPSFKGGYDARTDRVTANSRGGEIVDLAQSITGLTSALTAEQKNLDKERKRLDDYARRYGINAAESAIPKTGTSQGSIDPSIGGTTITSAAPKILNVNIDAIHKGNNNIYVKKEDIGRQVREEIKKANVEALSDTSILAGWNGE